MKLSILKCHGSGNDFVLIDETMESNGNIPDEKRASLTRAMCNREAGVGADGVLFYQSSETADCKMRMFNPDGGEAEMCGNGLRCIGRYCAERLTRPDVTVETMKSTLAVKGGKPLYAGVETFEAEIGPVSTRPGALPMLVDTDSFAGESIEELSSDLVFTALSVPNPHIVAIVDDIDEPLVERCGVRANHLRLFPSGVNVSLARRLGKNNIFVITYERGVGITYSCGTAMSASAYVSVIHGLSEAEEPISVYNRGGLVECDVKRDPSEHILLKGNATFVFEAEIEVGKDYEEISGQYDKRVRMDEVSAYGAFQDYVESVLNEIT